MAERQRWARVASVDMQDNEENRGIIEAIEETNEGANVIKLPGVVKIQVPNDLVIKREEVEKRIGREWDTQEFQLAIVSMSGNVKEWDEEEIVIGWKR